MPERRIGPPDDLDDLASRLNHDAARAAGMEVRLQDNERLSSWLARVREAGGSDLLLVSGSPPVVRAAGRMIHLGDDILDSDDIRAAVEGVVPPHDPRRTDGRVAIDVAFRLPHLGRFRMNVHRERGRVAAAIRALPTGIPTVAALRFSHDVALLSRLPRGLVLIGGPAGSGKTTTLAALIAAINEREERHIVTVEDPIEYEHPHRRSIVEQVEVGLDAPDFPSALRAALRQAPDVIVIGEMRDTDAFPTERQNAVRQELAMALAAVLTQTLIQVSDGTLAPAAELLVVGYGARQHIRKNALQHLQQEITITRKQGSFTLQESLARWVQRGLLSREDARIRAAHPEELDALLAAPPSGGTTQVRRT